jgi:tRNA 2-thiouridine synthesizing protein E
MKQKNGTVWLTTGQAAKLCSVTPATVLNWIRKGQLEGVRTAGGHYRIRRDKLEPLLTDPPIHKWNLAERGDGFRQSLRCWEYLGVSGTIREDCKECLVYRVGAIWCFHFAITEPTIGDGRLFCPTTCEDCLYFRRAMGRPTDVLVITQDNDLVQDLTNHPTEALTLHFAHNAYEASAAVQNFLPAFAVVDEEACGADKGELVESLACDPRLPGLRIVVAVPHADAGEDGRGDPYVAGAIEKPFGTADIATVVDAFPVECVEPKEAAQLQQRFKGGGTMIQNDAVDLESSSDAGGFLKTMSTWNRSTAERLAEEHDIGPLTDEHWKIIEFVQWYYRTHGKGPPVVQVHKETGLSSKSICELFPCGMVKGAYRLAGLPRPPGCA